VIIGRSGGMSFTEGLPVILRQNALQLKNGWTQNVQTWWNCWSHWLYNSKSKVKLIRLRITF